ncbi:hypothetical protein COLO4_08080 [Corchorus olitorius]|uniref:Uncharacterized protein n=1 Tax=Corchorus olitorius TaxID=93759 RepID=A0A1R3KHI5_9ROSI|nr:hypothetical protein COLO4_08080 [Corchorus olitorius]
MAERPTTSHSNKYTNRLASLSSSTFSAEFSLTSAISRF